MTSKIINDFVSKVDTSKDDYTLDELKKMLSMSFKSNHKKKPTEKKEPSKYNIFIREEIHRMKKENPEIDNKQLMSLAASKWKEHKAQTETQ